MDQRAPYNAERIDEARQRVSTMLALAAALETPITHEQIREASLVPIHPVGEFFAAVMANCALRNFEGVARVLAGLGDDRAIAMFMDAVDSPKALPAHRPRRPRRPRPTAADRAQAATEWLNGPARELGPEPEPSPDGGGGCP